MSLCLALVEQILCLLLMGLSGFALARFGVVRGADCRSFSAICVYIFVPCMLFSGFLIDWTPQKRTGILLAFAAALLIHAVFFLLTALLQGPLGLSPVDAASLVYTNAGNILIPLVAGTLGNEYIFYSSSYMIVQNLLLWGYSANVIGGKKGFQLGRAFRSPPIIAILLGLLFMMFPLHLPELLSSTLRSVGNCMAPASMILIGILMADISPKKAAALKGAGRVVLLRLFVYPLFALAVLLLLNRLVSHPDSWQILFVLVLAGAGPSASQVTQVAQMYDNEAEKASYINAATTLLCALTLPLMTLLAQYLLG